MRQWYQVTYQNRDNKYKWIKLAVLARTRKLAIEKLEDTYDLTGLEFVGIGKLKDTTLKLGGTVVAKEK